MEKGREKRHRKEKELVGYTEVVIRYSIDSDPHVRSN